ncbi:MAG: phage scaffolding protein [Sphaerochaeta sp.]
MKGLKELFEKFRADTAMSFDDFEKEHNKLLAEEFIPKTKFNEKVAELDNEKKTTAAQKKLIEDSAKDKEASEAYKTKAAELEKQLKEQDENFKKATADMKKTHAIETEMSKAGVKNIKALRALLNEDQISLNDKDELIGLKEQMDALKKSDPYMFADDKDAKGGNGGSGFQPNLGGGSQPSGGSGGKGGFDAATLAMFGLPTEAK